MMYPIFGILMLIVLFYVLLAAGIFAVIVKQSFFSESTQPVRVIAPSRSHREDSRR